MDPPNSPDSSAIFQLCHQHMTTHARGAENELVDKAERSHRWTNFGAFLGFETG